jgi:hypothetical protein
MFLSLIIRGLKNPKPDKGNVMSIENQSCLLNPKPEEASCDVRIA